MTVYQANQDFLPVFAAGNLGASEMPSTLSSPAVAKNCIAVGTCFSQHQMPCSTALGWHDALHNWRSFAKWA